MTYADARPWAVAIKEEVLSRRMPPWGAIKGFGEFRNEQALTPEQQELIVSWVEGGVPEGNAKDINPQLKPTKLPPANARAAGATVATADMTLAKPLPNRRHPSAKMCRPDNPFRSSQNVRTERLSPCFWLYEYSAAFAHPFLFKEPLNLPAGTVIRGVPAGKRPAAAAAIGDEQTMIDRKHLMLLALGILFSVAPIVAHHSIAGAYDTSRKLTVDGVVVQFQFINPHPFITIDILTISPRICGRAPNYSIVPISRIASRASCGISMDTQGRYSPMTEQ